MSPPRLTQQGGTAVTGGLARLSSCRTNEKGVAMKVFVAGATGGLGRQLVSLLVANGDDVVGVTPTGAKRDQLTSVGAQPVGADPLGGDAVGRAGGRGGPGRVL